LDCKRLIRDHVRFKQAIERTARSIAASLGRYAALHIRRGDFFGQYPQQNIPAPQLLERLLDLVPPGTRIYVASDERDRGFFSAFRVSFEVFFIEDFLDKISLDMSRASIACVEQLICAFADCLVGTKLSTFSGYINRLRGYHGARDTTIRFTDGSPGSEIDGLGSPRFSWVSWVDNGNPLWGREFKEAWDFEPT
jgi:hypothetical protein